MVEHPTKLSFKNEIKLSSTAQIFNKKHLSIKDYISVRKKVKQKEF